MRLIDYESKLKKLREERVSSLRKMYFGNSTKKCEHQPLNINARKTKWSYQIREETKPYENKSSV